MLPHHSFPSTATCPQHCCSVVSLGHLHVSRTHGFRHGCREVCRYGLKGLAAYAHHAERLGVRDPEVYAFVHDALAFLSSTDADDPTAVLDKCLEAGRVNFRVMQMLDEGHNLQFGTPEPTEVQMTPSEGKCLLVSGHDMGDLHAILEQTEGTGVNVYTHGEMLPAHSYPQLKKFTHLKGNYGGAWYRQKARPPGTCLLQGLQALLCRVLVLMLALCADRV